MALLQSDKAIFYHPLDDATESLQSQAWTGTGSFSAAKISSGFIADPGDSVSSFGTEKEFLVGTLDSHDIVVLSATKFVVLYQDGTDLNHGTAKVGTVSGTDITFGAETEFLAANGATTISGAKLTATTFVVAYQDASVGSGTGASNIGTVSGTDVTFGLQHLFRSATTGMTDVVVASLSTTKVVVAYRDNNDSNHGVARIGTVSGTDITYGTQAKHRSGGATDSHALAVMSATVYVVIYRDAATTGFGFAKVGTVSGTTITYGAESAQIRELPGSNNSVAFSLTSTALVWISRSNFGTDGGAHIGTVSGTDVTFGSLAIFNSGGTDSIGGAKISSTQFVVTMENGTPGAGASKVATVSGTDITYGAETLFRSGTGINALTSSPGVLDASSIVVSYRDDADSNHGTAKIGTLAGGGAARTAPTPGAYGTAASATKVAFCGWLKNPSA